jgi:hypothetical protein
MVIAMPNKINANTVEYRGEAEGLIITTKDFFSSFGELMPGDKKEGIALIRNTTKDKIEVFFKTEMLPKNDKYDEIDNSLLQKIKLKIILRSNNEEKSIYNGNLGAEDISKEYISLGNYEKNFDGEFIFEIEVPKELKNAYSLSETEVKWIFYVEKKDEENGSDKNGSDINDSNNTNSIRTNGTNSDTTNNIENKNNENNNKFIEKIVNNVKTGDYIYYIILIIILIIIINIILEVRRKKKNEKK